MKKNFRPWIIAAVVGAIALVFSSCTYDPYYSSVGGSYSSGYGQGYGYGGSNFSTSLFVSTGDPRWGYDPSCYSYYDYNSRRYYDPYLYGYYPVGYRPQVVIGAPHPYGWRPGRSYCPPPRKIRDVTVVNYHHREAAYRKSNYSWAKQVRSRPTPPASIRNQSQNRSNYGAPSSYNRNSPSTRSSSSSRYSPFSRSNPSNRATPSSRSSSGNRQQSGAAPSSSRGRTSQPQPSQPSSRQRGSNRLPSGYNTPVTGTQPQPQNSSSRSQRQPAPQPSSQGRSRSRSQPSKPSYQQGGERRSNSGSQQPSRSRSSGIRSLGQG